MAGWLLAISRDTELIRALARALIRDGGGGQLWALENPEQARRWLAGRDTLPCAILIDEPSLHGERLAAVAEELSWYAPLIVVACPERQARVASLVAAGKVDLVSRSDYCIPLAAALTERTLRWQREAEKQVAHPEQAAAATGTRQEYPPDEITFPAEALRTIGAMLENLELVLAERAHLPTEVARRLGRVADLAFDLKHRLRLLAGYDDERETTGVETTSRRM